MMSDFFELIYDAALDQKNELLTDDTEYKRLMEQVTDLSDEYKTLSLTTEQRQIVDELIHTEDLIHEKEMQAIYKKGILNCAEILKDLQLLQ